jgi:hypothetical protein
VDPGQSPWSEWLTGSASPAVEVGVDGVDRGELALGIGSAASDGRRPVDASPRLGTDTDIDPQLPGLSLR